MKGLNEFLNEGMDHYIKSSDGKKFTILDKNKKEVKEVSVDELKKLMIVGNSYSTGIDDLVDKFDKKTPKGKHWKYWKDSEVNVRIAGLEESVNEGKQRDMNNMSQYIIDLNNDLSHEENPKRKKLIQGDIEEAKKKLAKLKENLNESKVDDFKVGDKVTADVTKRQEAKVTEIHKDIPGMFIGGKRRPSFDMIHIEWQDKKNGLMTWAGRPEKFTKVK